MRLEIRPLSDALGAEVIGFDCSRPLDDDTFAIIHQAHLDHLVLVFREQNLTPRQQIDFSKRFGPLDAHPSQGSAHLEGYPDILVILSLVTAMEPFHVHPNGATLCSA